ncbi:MAG: winged helix-turn-helix domain-containing protein [Candidatus Hodarchaeota archaeon]
MENQNLFEDTKIVLTEGKDYLTRFFKSVAHEKRYEILLLLLEKSRRFKFLMEELGIKKTALSNHLSFLTNSFLVEKEDYGIYSLSTDGHDFLHLMAIFYQRSKFREYQIKRAVQTQYTRSYKSLMKVRKRIISLKPVLEYSWITYLGAFSGVFKSMGLELDMTTLGGYSGYSFIVNVAKGRLCPSGITALSPVVWKEIQKGTEEISNWKIERIENREPYPNTFPVSDADKQRAKTFFDTITTRIDSKDLPIILWGLPIPEYGIVLGYEGDSYICSTFRHLNNLPETPIKYDQLQAPGSLHAFALKDELKEKSTDIDYNAILRALNLMNDEMAQLDYVLGPLAYKEWADVLENYTLDETAYHGNSLIGGCAREASNLASKFLKNLTDKYTDLPQSLYLLKASEEYKRIEELMNDFVDIFPFALEGSFDRDQRKSGAKILREAFSHKMIAKKNLDASIKNWNTNR